MKRRHGFPFGTIVLGYRFSAVFLATVLFATASLFAQDYYKNTETFAGTVVFEGKPVAGAVVYLRPLILSENNVFPSIIYPPKPTRMVAFHFPSRRLGVRVSFMESLLHIPDAP